MFNFLIVWDSGIDNRVAKMIGNAAMECAGIFPNCNFHVYGTKRFSDTVSIDGLIANAKMRNGQVNAYDIVDGLERMDWKMLKNARFHMIVFTSRDLYPDGLSVNFCFGIQLHTTILQSVARYRHLPDNELQACITHIMCHELGHMFDAARGRDNGLVKIHPIYADHCEHEGCVMQQMSDVNCLRAMALSGKRGKDRFCLNCSMDMAFKIGATRMKVRSNCRIY